jgi:hypothetical protein
MSSLLPSNSTKSMRSDLSSGLLPGLENFAAEQLGSLQAGQYTVQVSANVGALVQAAVQPTNLVAKPSLVLQIPPAPTQAVGHVTAFEQAIVAIKAHQCLEMIGPAGVGKSAFIRQLAHHPAVTTSHSDGILYLTTISPIDDVIQMLGEQFYHLYPDSYLSRSEWQTALQDCQALVLINVPQPDAADLRQLCQLLPQSTLVWGSDRPCLTALMPEDAPPDQVILDRPIVPIVLSPDRELEPMTRRESAMAEQLTELDTPQRWILALLTALDGTALSVSQIAAITGPQEPRPSLQRLMRLGLVQGVAQRYQVVPAWQPWLAKQFDSEPWMERGMTVLQGWVRQQSPGAIVAELPVLMRFLQWAAQLDRSQDVLTLARSIDPALTLSKQWQQWGQALQWALQAAWQLEDPSAEAWAWHQLGTRSLLLEDLTTAYDALQQALKLRQGIVQQQGDRATAADQLALQVTENNRRYLLQNTLPIAQKQELQAARSWQRMQMSVVILAFVTFCAALGLGLGLKQWVAPQAEPSGALTGVDRP